jgi:hypothetical protein
MEDGLDMSNPDDDQSYYVGSFIVLPGCHLYLYNLNDYRGLPQLFSGPVTVPQFTGGVSMAANECAERG